MPLKDAKRERERQRIKSAKRRLQLKLESRCQRCATKLRRNYKLVTCKLCIDKIPKSTYGTISMARKAVGLKPLNSF